MIRERGVFIALILMSLSYQVLACKKLKEPDFSSANVFLDDCTQENNHKRACKCVQNNLDVNKSVFPKGAQPTDEVTQKLNKFALDKVKAGYLGLLDKFSTLENSLANTTKSLPPLNQEAPSCNLNKSFSEISCGSGQTFYSETQRAKIIDDFKQKFIAESQFLRKRKETSKNQKGFIKRENISKEASGCNKPLTDEFLGFVRDTTSAKSMDLIAKVPMMQQLVNVNLDDALKILNEREDRSLKNKDELSLSDLIDYIQLESIGDGKTDGLEAQIYSSPLLRRILDDPDHRDEILNRLRKEKAPVGTTAFSSYAQEQVQSGEMAKSVMKDMEESCQKLNQNFQKVLCLPPNAKILPSDKVHGFDKLKAASKGCTKGVDCPTREEKLAARNASKEQFQFLARTTNQVSSSAGENLAKYNSTLILAENVCNETNERDVTTEVLDDLSSIIPSGLDNLESFEAAAAENHENNIVPIAQNICSLMPETMDKTDLESLKSTRGSESKIKELAEGISLKSCQTRHESELQCNVKIDGDDGRCERDLAARVSACVDAGATALTELYKPGGAFDFLKTTYQDQALAEVQEQAEKDGTKLAPEQVDKLVEAKVKEKTDAMSTQDLMTAFSDLKERAQLENQTDLVSQLFNPPGSKKEKLQRNSGIEGRTVASDKRTTKSDPGKAQGSKFSSANINKAKKAITTAFKKPKKLNNVYNEILSRARKNPNRISTDRRGREKFPPLTPQERTQAIDDAVSSFNRPKEREPASTFEQDDFDFIDRDIKAAQFSDENPDRARPRFNSDGTRALAGFDTTELSPEEIEEKQMNAAYEAAVAHKEEAKRRALNPVPTSGVTRIAKGDGGGGGAGGGAGGAGVNLGRFAGGDGNAYDRLLAAVIADNNTGLSTEAYKDMVGFLNDPKQKEFLLQDLNDEENGVLFKKKFYYVKAKSQPKTFVEKALDFLSPIKSAHAKRRKARRIKKWRIEVVPTKTANMAKESMQFFYQTIKNSRHVKNNFQDFLQATQLDSMYMELLGALESETASL